MEVVAAFLLALLFFLALLLVMPWYVNWTLRLLVDPAETSYAAAVNLGFRSLGLGFSVKEGVRHVLIGSVDAPKWEKVLPIRERGVRKKLRRPMGRIPGTELGKGMIRVLKSARWVSFRLDGEVGLDDPGTTGRLFGAIWAVAAIIPEKFRHLEVSPEFRKKKIDLRCRSTLRIRPAAILWNLGPLLWKFMRGK